MTTTSYGNVWKIEITKWAVEKEESAARRRARSDMRVVGEDVRYVCRTRVARQSVGSGGYCTIKGIRDEGSWMLPKERRKGRRS